MKKLTSTLFSLLTIAILSTSCGMPILGKHVEKKGGSRLHSTTDSTFSSYVAAFEAEAKVTTSDPSFVVGDIPINFGTPENNNFQGVCYIYSDGTREIIVRANWWQSATDDDKESLIFHELGHCRLDREHDNSQTPTHDKASLMHEVIVRGLTFQKHRSAYVNELFTQDKTTITNSFATNP